jgi:hypothetical protein
MVLATMRLAYPCPWLGTCCRFIEHATHPRSPSQLKGAKRVTQPHSPSGHSILHTHTHTHSRASRPPPHPPPLARPARSPHPIPPIPNQRGLTCHCLGLCSRVPCAGWFCSASWVTPLAAERECSSRETPPPLVPFSVAPPPLPLTAPPPLCVLASIHSPATLATARRECVPPPTPNPQPSRPPTFHARSHTLSHRLSLTVIGSAGAALLPWGNTSSIYEVLSICRFILGMGVGGMYPMSAAKVAEEGDKPPDATKIGWSFFWQTPGSLLPYLVGWTLSAHAFDDMSTSLKFRIVLGLGCIPSGVVLINEWLTPPEPLSEEAKAHKAGWHKAGGTSGTWHTIMSHPKYLYQLIGTGGSWFLYDISYYGTAIFQPQILESIFNTTDLSYVNAATPLACLDFPRGVIYNGHAHLLTPTHLHSLTNSLTYTHSLTHSRCSHHRTSQPLTRFTPTRSHQLTPPAS